MMIVGYVLLGLLILFVLLVLHTIREDHKQAPWIQEEMYGRQKRLFERWCELYTRPSFSWYDDEVQDLCAKMFQLSTQRNRHARDCRCEYEPDSSRWNDLIRRAPRASQSAETLAQKKSSPA
jgi:hypothetical protein